MMFYMNAWGYEKMPHVYVQEVYRDKVNFKDWRTSLRNEVV